MSHTFSKLSTHIIFGAKDRDPFIDAEIQPELHGYLAGIVRNIGGIAMRLGGVADHVHLLVALKPTLPVSDALAKIKANSSKWVHSFGKARLKFAWQGGYSAFSVSPSNVNRVIRYIARQEQHHRRVTFRDEYVRF